MERSLPRSREKARKAAVMRAQITWVPVIVAGVVAAAVAEVARQRVVGAGPQFLAEHVAGHGAHPAARPPVSRGRAFSSVMAVPISAAVLAHAGRHDQRVAGLGELREGVDGPLGHLQLHCLVAAGLADRRGDLPDRAGGGIGPRFVRLRGASCSPRRPPLQARAALRVVDSRLFLLAHQRASKAEEAAFLRRLGGGLGDGEDRVLVGPCLGR
jgi:hypothetical protein